MKKIILLLMLIVVSHLHAENIDEEAKNRAFYQIEYRLVTSLIDTYKEENDAFNLFLFNDLTVWKTYIYNNYTSIYDNFDWDNLYIQTYGNQGDSLIVVLYDFPEPFRSPLAAYGAVVINREEVNYYTFELCYTGDYVLGKNTSDTHQSLGFYSKKSAEEFLTIVCKVEDVVLPALQK